MDRPDDENPSDQEEFPMSGNCFAEHQKHALSLSSSLGNERFRSGGDEPGLRRASGRRIGRDLHNFTVPPCPWTVTDRTKTRHPEISDSLATGKPTEPSRSRRIPRKLHKHHPILLKQPFVTTRKAEGASQLKPPQAFILMIDPLYHDVERRDRD